MRVRPWQRILAHGEATVQKLGLGEPLELLRLCSELQRVKAIVSRKTAIQVFWGVCARVPVSGLGVANNEPATLNDLFIPATREEKGKEKKGEEKKRKERSEGKQKQKQHYVSSRSSSVFASVHLPTHLSLSFSLSSRLCVECRGHLPCFSSET